MTPNDYSEDKLIQQSTAEFMEHELGWKSVFAFGKEVLGENGTLGRTSEKEVLLRPRFKAALMRLNPWMSKKQLEEALLKMTEHVSSASLMQINEQKYRYIRDGIPVTAYKPNGEQEEKRAIGIVKALRKALAEYTANESGKDGKDPTVDKAVLIENVMKTIASASQMMEEHHTPMQEHLDAENFEKLSKLKDAANALSETVDIRKKFCSIANTLKTLWKYLCQEDITEDMLGRKNVIVAIRKELQKKRKHVDISNISVVINGIINEHLEVGAQSVGTACNEHPIIDISKINFDILRREFAKSKRKNLVMRDLESMIQERLARMIATNGNRVNFYEHYQKIIKEYNSEQDRANIEKVFEDLLALSAQMDEEEKRYVREGFENDEQLAVYDLLFKENLSKEDIKKVKAVSKELLTIIKDKVEQMSQPFENTTARAEIQRTILTILWKELPECYPDESLNLYRNKIYEYISTIYAA